MKDYTFDEKEKEKFILNYEIFNKSSEIIVYFATGETYIIPYTQENEKKLLDKMRKQVKESGKFEAEVNKKIDSLKNFKIPLTIFFTIFFPTMVLGACYGKEIPTFAYCLIGCWGTAGVSILIKEVIEEKILKNKLKDLAKNRKFLDKEREIIEALEEEKNRVHQNTLSNVSLKTDKQISNAVKSDRPAIDINTVDRIPEEDLDQILSNIERDKAFGFDYTNASMLPKKRTKKNK